MAFSWISRMNILKIPGSWKSWFLEYYQNSSKCTRNSSYASLMIPRHHINDPRLILWSSIFHDFFSWFWPNVPVFLMFPSYSWNKLDTILKYVKNHYNSNHEWSIWLRLALDNFGQRGHRTPNRRNPLWPLWRLPVTHKRVLRTTLKSSYDQIKTRSHQ